MISPQTEEQSRTFVDSKHLTMEILSDPGNEVAKKYGLVYKVPDDLKAVYLDFGIDLPEYNGDDSWTLPMPARYVIDRDGVIRHSEVSTDYTMRSDPSHTIDALKSVIRERSS
jgi:peroxiredoxin